MSRAPGTGWACDSCISFGDAPVELLDVVSAVSEFLAIPLTVRDDDTYEAVLPARGVGFPAAAAGPELQSLADQLLCEERLDAVLSCTSASQPEAMAVFPFGAIPIQQSLLRRRGSTWPWSVSLRQPHPDRDRRKALLIRTGTATAELEIRAVQQVLTQGGFTVEALGGEDLDAAEFLAAYGSDEPDVVWVVGHGEYDHDDPRRTHLPMPNGSEVSALALANEAPDTPGRRLLVLNTCDSATVLIAGGLPEFGLGASAASPSQAVIGHAWPVVAWPDAVVFGRLLAGALCLAPSFFSAYEATVSTLLGGKDAVLASLDGTGEDLDDRIRLALDGHYGERLEELATWGSALFIE